MTRTNSLGTAKIRWEAFNSMGNLEETSGTITFVAKEKTMVLRLKLKQDNVSLFSIFKLR